MAVHELTQEQARRVAVRAQLLDAARPTDLLEIVRRLTLLQIDPTAAVAPNADLVAWSRLGSSYSPADLDDGAATSGRCIELQRADPARRGPRALPRGDGRRAPGRAASSPAWRAARRDWVEANDACRRDILARLRASGPLPSRELPDTCVVPWRSTGWTNNRNVTQMLEFLCSAGEVAVAGRQRRRAAVGPRRAGLPRRPGRARRGGAADPQRAAAAGARHRPRQDGRSARSSRRTSARRASPPWSRASRAQWRVDPVLARPTVRGTRGAAVAVRPAGPRPQAGLELFEFDYQLEMYKPAAQAAVGLLRAADPATATGSSGSSTPPPTARPACCGSTRSTRTCRSRRR